MLHIAREICQQVPIAKGFQGHFVAATDLTPIRRALGNRLKPFLDMNMY